MTGEREAGNDDPSLRRMKKTKTGRRWEDQNGERAEEKREDTDVGQEKESERTRCDEIINIKEDEEVKREVREIVQHRAEESKDDARARAAR